MKIKKLCFFFCILLTSCKSNGDDQMHLTARKFIELLKNGEMDKVYEMLDTSHYGEKWRHGIYFDVDKAHNLFQTYGVPAESEWEIQYDTSRPIYKIVNIIVPIYRDDKNSGLKEAKIIIGFDVTGTYVPNTLVANYEVYTRYWKKP